MVKKFMKTPQELYDAFYSSRYGKRKSESLEKVQAEESVEEEPVQEEPAPEAEEPAQEEPAQEEPEQEEEEPEQEEELPEYRQSSDEPEVPDFDALFKKRLTDLQELAEEVGIETDGKTKRQLATEIVAHYTKQ